MSDKLTFHLKNKDNISVLVNDWKMRKNELTNELTGYEIEYSDDNETRIPFLDRSEVIAVTIKTE